MADPDEEEGAAVVLAEATVGADGSFAVSVNMQQTTEEEPDPPAQDDGGIGVGDVIKGAIVAAGTLAAGAATIAGTVVGGVIDAATSGDGESSSSDP